GAGGSGGPYDPGLSGPDGEPARRDPASSERRPVPGRFRRCREVRAEGGGQHHRRGLPERPFGLPGDDDPHVGARSGDRPGRRGPDERLDHGNRPRRSSDLHRNDVPDGRGASGAQGAFPPGSGPRFAPGHSSRDPIGVSGIPAGSVPRSARDLEILRSLARRINPDDAGAHNNLGVVYYQKGLNEEAIGEFERALELDPHMQVAERNLQIAYFHTGYFERLVSELRKRLERDSNDVEARRRLARA